MADDSVHQIKELTDKIDKAKTAKARLEGERSNLARSMKEDHGVATISEAKKKVKKLQEDHDNLQTKIERDLKRATKKMEEVEYD